VDDDVTTVDEAATQQGGQFQAGLFAGLQQLSNVQEVIFSQYIRHVLPLDGSVYWLKTQEKKIPGALHYDARAQQLYDESFAVNRVVFTTTTPVELFDQINPGTLWIGEAAWLKFAFSQLSSYFQQAGLYHYRGDAVYPVMQAQLLDVGAEPPDDTLIVSNSLPVWLSMMTYNPPWLVAGNPGIQLYPSFLVPDNLRPPYGAVHIPPESTQAMAGIPVIGRFTGHHWQLASETVDIILYGTNNDQALAFLDLVNQFSLDTGLIGMMSAAIVRDEKRTQTELGVLAQKKTIRFEVNYLQQAMPDVAMPLILSVPINYQTSQAVWQEIALETQLGIWTWPDGVPMAWG
jgi:hypothetical protein